MVRSSYIDWLLEQELRNDGVGDVARWLSAEMDKGFEPVDMFCLLDRTDGNDHLFESIKGGLVEFAMTLKQYTEISDAEATESKLEVALRNEEYLKAAELRDQLKNIRKNNNQ
jgi:hypothetical protein